MRTKEFLKILLLLVDNFIGDLLDAMLRGLRIDFRNKHHVVALEYVLFTCVLGFGMSAFLAVNKENLFSVFFAFPFSLFLCFFFARCFLRLADIADVLAANHESMEINK